MKILPKMKKEGMVINVYGICVCKMHVSFTLKSYIFIAIVSNAFEEDVSERNISCSNNIGKNGGNKILIPIGATSYLGLLIRPILLTVLTRPS